MLIYGNPDTADVSAVHAEHLGAAAKLKLDKHFVTLQKPSFYSSMKK